MIVELVTGADERPEARVVDIDDLGRLHLALGQAGFFGAGFVFWYWEHRRERAAQAACTGH